MQATGIDPGRGRLRQEPRLVVQRRGQKPEEEEIETETKARSALGMPSRAIAEVKNMGNGKV